MSRDSCILYLGYSIGNSKWMLEHPFLLEYLSHLEFKGVHYLAKSCGNSIDLADLELLVEHLYSLIEKIYPEAHLDRGGFVLFPLVC